MSSFLYVVVLTLSLVCRLSATPVVYRRSGDETCPTFPSYQSTSFKLAVFPLAPALNSD